MKALICNEFGPPSGLHIENIPSPRPDKNEVLITVKACSVNFPDTLIIQGLYQFKPPLPFSPGSDLAGIIIEIGEEVKNHKIGDEVFGFVQYGGFAELVVAPSNMIFPKDPNMDFNIAASFMMAYGTSYHALKDRANLKKGNTLLVLGASGGVGLAAVDLGKQMGATVIAAASSNEKLELCKLYGADHSINYLEEDLKICAKELTDGKGVDVVFDPVGGDYTEMALRATAWDGNVLIVGFPAGIAKIPMNLPLLKSCNIKGVFWGSFAVKFPRENRQNTLALIQMYNDGEIKPYIDKVYDLEDASRALEDMINRKVMGKIIICP